MSGTKPELEPDLDAEPEFDPRLDETPPARDFGIPRIDVDQSGRFKVPRLNANGFLLEEAKTEFYLGLNMDVPQSIAWLWPGRIPVGKLTLIEGASNSGTSFLMADIAARVSSGSPWPDGSLSLAAPAPVTSPHLFGPNITLLPEANHVMIVNGGDNMYDTLLPRLIKMGAQLSDFTILERITVHDPLEMRAGKAETARRLSLPADLGHVEYQLRQRPDTRLLVVDSLSDFCQTDRQFRETLRGLHEIAERCHVAVVATARPKTFHGARNKLQPSADRRSESVRCVLNVLVDPHDPSQRYLAPARMNFCLEPLWLPFRIREGAIAWGEELETAPVFKRASAGAAECASMLQEAMNCLRDTLAIDDMPAKSALKQVMECGYSKATVVRARRALGVRSYREGFGSCGWWTWSLKPEGEGKGEKTGAAQENGAHETGADGNSAVSNIGAAEAGASGSKQAEPDDEFGGVSFERIFRAAILDTLQQDRAMELAAMGRGLANENPESNGKHESNGKPAKNGKPGTNGKRKPR